MDVVNAFNTIDRAHILKVLLAHAPELVPWVIQTFQPAPLVCGEELLWSRQGVQQGDPLGPLLFALGLHPLIQKVPAEGFLHRWYLDDGVVLAPTQVLQTALEVIATSFPSAGLVMNLKKTTLWGPATSPGAQGTLPALSFLRRISHKAHGDVLRVLGVPVVALGHEGALRSHLATLAEGMADQLQLVASLPDKQVAHAILRSCLGPIKASYLLRTLVHEHTGGLVSILEKAQRSSWSAVLGGHVTKEAWIQSTLPISRRGLRIAISLPCGTCSTYLKPLDVLAPWAGTTWCGCLFC